MAPAPLFPFRDHGLFVFPAPGPVLFPIKPRVPRTGLRASPVRPNSGRPPLLRRLSHARRWLVVGNVWSGQPMNEPLSLFGTPAFSARDRSYLRWQFGLAHQAGSSPCVHYAMIELPLASAGRRGSICCARAIGTLLTSFGHSQSLGTSSWI